MAIDVSLGLLDSVHARMVTILRGMGSKDWARRSTTRIPEAPRTLDWFVQSYAWHSRHHLAHITSLRQREGWLAEP